MARKSEGSAAPLAARRRPKLPDDIIGQEKIWATDSPLWALVKADRFTSLLLWGPPGTGKTSLAQVIASASDRDVELMSAVQHGVKEIRAQIARSEGLLAIGDKALLIFMDEIHRLSKSQQDILLPALEAGTIKFIGATTENPSFTVNNAILSRTLVFKLESLSPKDLERILRGALESPDSELARTDVGTDVIQAIARAADGDARRALNLLEAVVFAAPANQGAITIESLAAVAPTLNIRYDRDAESHFDLVSAMIKSIRASQPDAAVYYLARMLAGGEDPMFIARRLVIAASEDIGNANPTAQLLAQSCMQAVHAIGMPEARIMLSQAATYLAASPKSNKAYVAINQALADVEATGALEVPLHLRNAPTKLMREFGYGVGYVYAHDDPSGAQRLDYLPKELAHKSYYEPINSGVEAQLKANLERLKAAGRSPTDP
jgi:putative ATPase